MTDREMLQSLKSMIDAQLGTNVIPVVPVVPPAVVPVTPVQSSGNTFLDDYGQSNQGSTTTVTTGSPPPANVPQGYEGHDLSKGHPRINMEYAGNPGVYTFTGPGTVYYQVVSGTDSGMRVTSYVTDSNGNIVVPTETRVISNKQPFPVNASGPCTFYVTPEKTGPISVGLE